MPKFNNSLNNGKKVSPEIIRSSLENCGIVDGPPEPYGPDNPKSRAVARFIIGGEDRVCVHCGETAKFQAKKRLDFLILATVVEEDSGKWLRNEIFYPPSCYEEAGAPYGDVYTLSPQQGVEMGKLKLKNSSLT